MGLLKRLGYILLLYVIIDIAWSVMVHMGHLPSPSGLEGPLNILYVVFELISFIYFIIVISLGLYSP
ncbi:MAG: hypothetical protein JW779_15910 [Candidatus Thorarchaeota archaeon]|nr:hypothetical protein [Candidatus Thorarchaeota archaeon]